MNWRVALSLDVLLEEINHASPGRSKVSDGSIGDAAHATRTSDHNPWVRDHRGTPVVRARDFTHDPSGGLNCHQLAARLADLLAAGTHPALRSGAYIIWDHQILSRDRVGEGWRPYAGANPHTQHLHLSVALDRAGYDSTHPWGIATTREEDDMFEPEDRQLLREVHDLVQASQGRERRIRERVNAVGRRVRELIDDNRNPGGVEARVLLRELREVSDQLAAIEDGSDG